MGWIDKYITIQVLYSTTNFTPTRTLVIYGWKSISPQINQSTRRLTARRGVGEVIIFSFLKAL